VKAYNCERAAPLEQGIQRLPRIVLSSVRTTPVEHLPRLSTALGGPPVYIKRDDLTGLAFGGNKTRMLEFAVADALAKGAEVIVCGSAVQSNYCRQMAAACARYGLELHLVLCPVRPIDREEFQGNHLLMRLLGAHVTVLESPDTEEHVTAIAARAQELVAAGRKVYRPRQEDTVDLDALAYTEAALETVRQCQEMNIAPKDLYLAALDTTQAGLVLGMRYLESPIHVQGISPYPNFPDRHATMAAIANQGAGRLDLDIKLAAGDFDNDDSFVGDTYGYATEAGMEAMTLLAQTEGILVDPVYTGKALGAMFSHIRSGKVAADAPVLFMHTGGAPAMFAYSSEVVAAL
jgi:L-cysteate sulfo-lyase